MDGTKTIEESFADLFEGIGKAFLDLAAQILAQKLLLTILEAFNPGGGITGTQSFLGGEALGSGLAGLIKREEGGPVDPSKTFLVGEKGPEIFVPNTSGTIVPNEFFDAARQALQPSGGNISDSSDTSEAFAAATAALERNTTNIVNRQSTVSQETSFNNFAESLRSEQRQPIRFETVRVGEIDMVTKEEALKIGADSAKAAEANVFSALKNKPSVRRSIGMS